MASAFTHVLVAQALRAFYPRDPHERRLAILGALCSALPDADAIGYWYGVPYEHALGHRGCTHSVFAALVLAALCATCCFRDAQPWSRQHLLRARYLFLATFSHGVLDALTNGGLGIAFLWPLSDARYFFPWRPVQVSPISVSDFFSRDGLAVMVSELLWIWVPVCVVWTLAILARRRPGVEQAVSGDRDSGVTSWPRGAPHPRAARILRIRS